MDFAAYLAEKGVQLKPGSNSNFYTQCFLCGEDPSKRGRLYFNLNPESPSYGLYFCFLCDSKGGINSIRKHFGDPPVNEDEYAEEFGSIYGCAADYYAERLYENPDAYSYLTIKRGLTEETIKKLKLGWADGGLLTHLIASGYTPQEAKDSGLINQVDSDFLYKKITIPFFQFGNVVSLRGKDIEGKYLSLPGAGSRLYGVDAVRGQDTVVVCAGEFDTMVLQQLGYNACGVPGERIWKEKWTDLLTDARRIFIVFDNDTTGREGAEKLANTLGPRSRVAEMPKPEPGRKKIDVSEWYVNYNKTREDFDQLFMKAKGGLLVSVEESYEQWLAFEGNPEVAGLRFNVKEIDSQMNHGMLPGHLLVMLAKTNAGKTMMSINLLHRMLLLKPDAQFLLLTLEQGRNEWFERAHKIHNFYEPGSTVLDTVNFWKNNLFLVDKNRITEDELELCLDQYKYERGAYPDFTLIDYFGYYARGIPEDSEYGRMTSGIMGLKAIARDLQIRIGTPHQVNRQAEFGERMSMDQGRGAGTIEETADMILSLRNLDQAKDADFEQRKNEVIMEVKKSRDGAIGAEVSFCFAPLTLAMIPKSDPLYARALKERTYAYAGDDWLTAVERHKNGDTSL